MDKIWVENPSKLEVIGRCGGVEKTEWPRRTDKSRTLKKQKNLWHVDVLVMTNCKSLIKLYDFRLFMSGRRLVVFMLLIVLYVLLIFVVLFFRSETAMWLRIVSVHQECRHRYTWLPRFFSCHDNTATCLCELLMTSYLLQLFSRTYM